MKLILLLIFGLLPGVAWAQSSPFAPGANPISNQAYSAAAVTPSDTVSIGPTRALYNGGTAACNIAVTTNGSSTAVTFSNVQIGEILPIQAVLVKATGTTCTNIVALY